MRKHLSKLSLAAAVGMSAIALAAPGVASADPRPCHNGDTLLPASVESWYAIADRNGNGYICLGIDKKSGLLTDIGDDKVH